MCYVKYSNTFGYNIENPTKIFDISNIYKQIKMISRQKFLFTRKYVP